MKRGKRRGMLWGLLGLLLLAGLAFAFWPRPVPVDMAEVSVAPLRITVDEEGETRVKDVFVVSAPLDGRLLRVEQDVGDAVTGSESVIAVIRPQEPTFLDLRSQREAEAEVKAAEAMLHLAEAELDRVKAELVFAKTELRRAQRLAERGNISQRSLDSATLNVNVGEASVASALATIEARRFNLETARAQLIAPGNAQTNGAEQCCVEVKAPVSGRILKIIRESESVVTAGEPLIEIGDPGNLEIVSDLLSSDAVQVKVGAEVFIEDWGGGASLAGRVLRVEPYGFTKTSALGIDEQRVNVIIDFTDQPEAWRPLGHGFRVQVKIVTWQEAEVLQVPLGALFRSGKDWAVFVEQEGRANLRRIEVGQINDEAAEVLNGLTVGERVVTYPSDRVVENGLIAARDS